MNDTVDITKGEDIHKRALTYPDSEADRYVDMSHTAYEAKPFYQGTALDRLARDAEWEHEYGYDSPIQQKGVVGLGDSYYDNYVRTEEDLQDLNEVRAREQGFWSKFGNGVGRFAAETLNTGVGNIVGTVVGLYQGIDNLLDEDPNTSFWQGMWHNSVTEVQDEIRKSVEEALPLYKSKAESELGALSSMLTQNFWMELMSSAGFTAGMLTSTALTGGMGVGSAASSLLRAAGASEEAVNFAYRLISGIMGSVSESGMEALNNYNESKQHYTQENIQRYNAQKMALQQQMESDILKEIMLSNPTLKTDRPVRDYEQESAIKQKYEQMYAEDFAKLDSDFQNGMADIENRALGAGTMTFGLNMAILGLSNSMGTLSFLKAPSANAEREVKKSLFKNLFSPNPSKPLGEGITKAEAKMIGLREGLNEGFEESNQKWASNLAKQYYGSDYDPEATDKFSRFLETSMDTFKNTYTDPETWKEWLMGAITGLSGTFNPGGIVKAAKGEKVGLSDFWQGGVVEAFREGSKLAERSQKAYDEMNKLVTDKKLQDNFRLGVFNLASKQRQMEAAARGDKFNYENENDGQTIRMIQTFANAGELNTLSALIGNNQNMSDEELNALCEGFCEKNEKKYGDNRYHSEYSFLLTDNGERISDILDNNDPRRKEAKEKIAKESKRIQDMIRTYQKSINEADAKTGYQLEPEKLNFIAWGLTQAKSWEERINSMRDKVGKKYSGILSEIADKFRNYKLDLDSFQEQEDNLKQELVNIDSEIKKDPDNANLKAQRKDIAEALDDFTKLKENLEEQQKFVKAYGDFISFLNGDTTNERGQKLDGLSVLSSSFLNNASTKENVYQQIASTLQNFSENEIPYQDKKEFLDILKDMNKCANAVHNISNYVNKLMDNPEELQHTFDAFNDDFLNEQIEAYGELYRQSLQNLPAVVQRDDIAAMMKQYDDVMSYYKQQYDKYIQPVEDKLADIESMIADIKATTKDYNRINELQKQKVNYEKRLKELRSFRSKFYAKIRKIKKAAENAMKNLNPNSKELIDAIEETDRLLAEYLPNILDVINSDDAAFREMKTLPVIIRRGEIAYEGQEDGITKSEYIAKLLDRWQHDKQNEVFAKTKELLFRLIHLAYQNNFSPSLVSDLEFYNIANELGMSLNDVTDTSTLRDRIATVIVKKILDANRNDIKALNPYYSKELVKVDNSREREDFGVSSVPVNMSEVLQGMAEDVEYVEYTEDGDVVLPKLEPLADLTEEEIAASEEQYKISVARSIVDNILLEDKKKYVAELANMRRKKANREGLIDRILQVIANDEDTTAEELIKRTRNEIRREKAKEKREAERRAKEKEALEKKRIELKNFVQNAIDEIRQQKQEIAEKLQKAVQLSIEKLKAQKEATAENLKSAIDTATFKLEEQKQSLQEQEKAVVEGLITKIGSQKQEVDKALDEAKREAEEKANDGVFDDSNHTPVLSFTRSTTPQRYGSDGQMHKTEGFENVFALPEIKEAFDFVNSGKLDAIVKSNAKEGLYTRVYVSKKEGFDDVAFLYIKDTSGNNQCIGFISKGKSFIANNIITEDNQYQYGYWTDENSDNHYTSIALPRKDGNKQVGTDIKSVYNQDNSLLSILGTYKSSETISTNYVPLQNANVGSNDIEKAFDNGDVTVVFIKRASTEMLDIFNDKTFPLKDSDNVVVENSSIPFYVCVYPNTDYSLLRKISFSVTAIDLANTSVSDIQNGNDEVLKSLLDNFKSLANQLVKISKIKGDVSKNDKSDLGKACFNCMQNLFIPGCTSWYPEFSVNKNTKERFNCFLNAVDTNQNTIVTFDIRLNGRSNDEMADYIVEQMFIQLQNGGHRNNKVQKDGKYTVERENCIDNGTVIYIKPNIKLSDRERNFSTYMKYYAVNTSEDSNDIGRTNCNYYVGFSGTNEYHQLNPISSYKKLKDEPKSSGKTTIGIGNVVYVENDEDSNTQRIVDKDGNELSDSELISLTDPNLIIDSTFDISIFRNKLIYYITSGSKSDVIDVNNDFYFDVNTGTIQKRIASNDIDWKEEFKNSTVIWAHPTAGKTTLYDKGDSRVIDFDSVAKPEIAEAFGLPRTTTPKELSQYCTFNATKEVRGRYYNLLYQKFLELAEKAKNEGKKLLVSDMYLIRSKQSDIDMVITMSDEKFASGLAKRGEERNDRWKNDINTQVVNYRNAFGKVFNMSDNESEYLEQILDKYIDNQSNIDIQQNESVQELNLGCQDDDLDLDFREVRSYGDSLNLSEGEYSLSEITKTLNSNEDVSQQTIDFISRNAYADTKVVVVSNEDFERVREREGKPDILGFYSKSNNTVVVPSAADATTIVHEMAHSATSNMLGYIYRNKENDNNALLVSELNNLINDIREAYNNSPSDFSNTNLQYVLSKTGLTATKELFSEILSDKNLQYALARTKANNSSTFMDKVKAFINKLLNAFGFGGKNSEFSSIFDRFNDISNRVENNYESHEESNTSSNNENTSNEEEEKMSDKEMADFCEKNNYDLQEFKKIPVLLQNEIKKC